MFRRTKSSRCEQTSRHASPTGLVFRFLKEGIYPCSICLKLPPFSARGSVKTALRSSIPPGLQRCVSWDTNDGTDQLWDMFLLTVNVSAVNALNDDLGRLAVDLATDTVSGAEDLLHGALELLGKGLVAHGTGNLDDLVEADRLVVLDVLLLLPVARGLLQRLDDKGGSSRDDRDSRLTVLDGELDGHAQAFLYLVVRDRLRCDFSSGCAYPVASSLRDVLTNLLGRQTQRADLGSESRRGTHLTASGTEVAKDVCQLDRTELGSASGIPT